MTSFISCCFRTLTFVGLGAGGFFFHIYHFLTRTRPRVHHLLHEIHPLLQANRENQLVKVDRKSEIKKGICVYYPNGKSLLRGSTENPVEVHHLLHEIHPLLQTNRESRCRSEVRSQQVIYPHSNSLLEGITENPVEDSEMLITRAAPANQNITNSISCEKPEDWLPWLDQEPRHSNKAKDWWIPQ